jgi:hypothetical protein
MNKIKDLFYNINDIVIAVIVLCVAIVVILTRVDAIMSYPETMASSTGPKGGYVYLDDLETSSRYNDEDQTENEDEDEEGEDEDTSNVEDFRPSPFAPQPEVTTPPEVTAPSSYTLQIASGESMNTVGNTLVSWGFFESTRDFLNALESQNAGTRVKAGTFTIPANSTAEDIVRIITGGN